MLVGRLDDPRQTATGVGPNSPTAREKSLQAEQAECLGVFEDAVFRNERWTLSNLRAGDAREQPTRDEISRTTRPRGEDRTLQ
jgi:hypothetical protein